MARFSLRSFLPAFRPTPMPSKKYFQKQTTECGPTSPNSRKPSTVQCTGTIGRSPGERRANHRQIREGRNYKTNRDTTSHTSRRENSMSSPRTQKDLRPLRAQTDESRCDRHRKQQDPCEPRASSHERTQQFRVTYSYSPRASTASTQGFTPRGRRRPPPATSALRTPSGRLGHRRTPPRKQRAGSSPRTEPGSTPRDEPGGQVDGSDTTPRHDMHSPPLGLSPARSRPAVGF